MKLYSKTTGWFYDEDIHGANVPADAEVVSDDEYRALLTGQSAGMAIVPGPGGSPVLAPPQIDPSPPQSVTRRQARRALEEAGLLETVETYFSTQASTADRIDYEDAQTFDRDWPALTQAATALGLSSIQLDQLFVAASTL
ncbi:hypothetical protein [Methyloversatilis sp. NSM2]|uniref:hypothetical protein n=1 Tax=Methyloversatilis sp. NSM2 TaxID=3134135 RepID=UPI003115FC7D